MGEENVFLLVKSLGGLPWETKGRANVPNNAFFKEFVLLSSDSPHKSVWSPRNYAPCADISPAKLISFYHLFIISSVSYHGFLVCKVFVTICQSWPGVRLWDIQHCMLCAIYFLLEAVGCKIRFKNEFRPFSSHKSSLTCKSRNSNPFVSIIPVFLYSLYIQHLLQCRGQFSFPIQRSLSASNTKCTS